MDINVSNLKGALEPRWANFGRRKGAETTEKVLEMMKSANFNVLEDQAPSMSL